MAGKFNLELKVGIFAFIGLIILTLAVFSISEVYILRPGYFIQVCFDFASGIDIGAPVRIAGIEAGEVKEVKMVYDRESGRAKAMLSIWLEEGFKLPGDSDAFVSMLGLIGDTYLEIVPGDDYDNLLEEGDMLVGRDPASTDTVMEIVRSVAAKFENLLDCASDLLDEKMRTDFKQAVSNANSFTGNLDETLDEEAKTKIKEAIEDIRATAENVKVITGRLERGEGKLGHWLKPTKSDIQKREKEEKEIQREEIEPTQNF
ncbi:MAG: MCE family protein [Candidatus Omnitrophica bacterium]|nr:MCE family protein [Candidatus Omnitrophota bacterium]